MAMPGQYSQGAPPYGNQPGGGYGYGQNEYQGQPLMQGGGYGGYPQQPGNYPQQGYPQQPNAAANSLRQMQTTTSMNLVFFAAACCVMLGSFIGGIFLFFSFELVDFLEMSYLFIFGAILAVLDTPLFRTIKAMGDLKMYIGKYINLLTRVTGKGGTFLFLGASLFSNMWYNLEGGFLIFLSVVLCLVPMGVGLTAIVIGIMKSQKLSKARRMLEMSNIEQQYDRWAQTYRQPNGGLTPAEFNSLTMDNGGFKWEDPDLKLIFNALVSNPAWRISAAAQTNAGGRMQNEEPKIPKEDLLAWVKGGITLL